ncbi:MAG TPA: glycosyltransferase, partial [Woeseiaceae bacterium]
ELPGDLQDKGAKLRSQHFGKRPVWIAASTHDGEEGQLLDAHARLRASLPDALLVLVPRHPDRFSNVAAHLSRRGIKYVARTQGVACTPDTEVFLGDTMGEVPLFYAASDIAFVGGTLVPVGGHNLLEPAALGLPIVTGPHLFNTEDIAEMFSSVGASRLVHSDRELARTLQEWFENPELAQAIGNKGRDIVIQNRGALDRFLTLLQPLMKGIGG